MRAPGYNERPHPAFQESTAASRGSRCPRKRARRPRWVVQGNHKTSAGLSPIDDGASPMRILLLALVGLPAIALAGCTSPTDTYTTLATRAWKERLDATPEAWILDVRTPAEYAEGHIPNSTLIPYTEIEQRAAELPADKAAPIFVYCRSGSRSAIASQTLADLGYTNVVNMDGGFPDWARAGYPSETGPA